MPDRPRSEPLRGRDLLGLGGLLVGCVVGCTAVGLLVDHLAGSDPAGAVGGVAIGLVLGGVGFVARVRRALRDTDSDTANDASRDRTRDDTTE